MADTNDKSRFFVRAIGSFEYEDTSVMSLNEAVSEIAKRVNNCVNQSGCADMYGYELSYKKGDHSATLIAEEFYQTYYIVRELPDESTLNLLHYIVQLCDSSDCETARYQYTMDDCGVYDYIYSIRELAERLISRCEEGEL